jgi:hypothetical protein
LPFSRRERAAETSIKSNDLAREAVGWNGVFGGNVHGDYVCNSNRCWMIRAISSGDKGITAKKVSAGRLGHVANHGLV